MPKSIPARYTQKVPALTRVGNALKGAGDAFSGFGNFFDRLDKYKLSQEIAQAHKEFDSENSSATPQNMSLNMSEAPTSTIEGVPQKDYFSLQQQDFPSVENKKNAMLEEADKVAEMPTPASPFIRKFRLDMAEDSLKRAMPEDEYNRAQALVRRISEIYAQHGRPEGTYQWMSKYLDMLNKEKGLDTSMAREIVKSELRMQQLEKDLAAKKEVQAGKNEFTAGRDQTLHGYKIEEIQEGNKGRVAAAGKGDTKTTNKLTNDLYQRTQRGVLGKLNEMRILANTTNTNIEKFAADPSGYTDYGTLMAGLKSLQADPSVVRETEIRMGTNATSVINKGRNAIQRAIDGESLQPGQREDILKAMRTLVDGYNSAYKRAAMPTVETAKRNNIPLNEIFDDPAMFEANILDGKVKVSNGKETLMIDAKDLSDAKKDGYSEVP